MRWLIGVLTACLCSPIAFGTTVITVQSVAAEAGASGAFDVSLTNTDVSPIIVGAFSFGISTTSTSINFTDANTSTVSNPYIFSANSLFGPDLTGSTGGQGLSVSDVFATPLAGASIGSGQTVDLGHIVFTTAADSTAGTYTISLVPNPATSLSDPSGNDIPVNTLSNGDLTISGASSPEPSTLLLLLVILPFILREGRAARRDGTCRQNDS